MAFDCTEKRCKQFFVHYRILMHEKSESGISNLLFFAVNIFSQNGVSFVATDGLFSRLEWFVASSDLVMPRMLFKLIFSVVNVYQCP